MHWRAGRAAPVPAGTARLITAGVLIPLFAGALLWLPNSYWILFLLPLLLTGSWEWAGLAGYSPYGRWTYSIVIALSALVILTATSSLDALMQRPYLRPDGIAYGLAALFWLGVAPLWLARGWRAKSPLLLGLTGWVVLVPTWLALVEMQTKPLHLLLVLGVVWVADSAAYFAGSRFGSHKLAPNISPGKTWEGIAGAVVGVGVYYLALHLTAGLRASREASASVGLILCAVMTVMSVEGDLFESWMKRLAGVKDSGAILPGHGGLLDRIDGLTASLPFAALMSVYTG